MSAQVSDVREAALRIAREIGAIGASGVIGKPTMGIEVYRALMSDPTPLGKVFRATVETIARGILRDRAECSLDAARDARIEVVRVERVEPGRCVLCGTDRTEATS